MHRQYDKVVCSQFIQITHSDYTASRQHNASVLKMGLSECAHFFQNKRRWCIKTETARHQQYISNGFTQ